MVSELILVMGDGVERNVRSRSAAGGDGGSRVGGLGDGARAVGDGQGGGLSDGVGLAAVGDLGGLRAVGGQGSDDLGGVDGGSRDNGGCGRVDGSCGVDRGSRGGHSVAGRGSRDGSLGLTVANLADRGVGSGSNAGKDHGVLHFDGMKRLINVCE